MYRAGSAGLTPKVRRVDGWQPKHNFDDDGELEVDPDKVKYLGVPNRNWVLRGKDWGKAV